MNRIESAVNRMSVFLLLLIGPVLFQVAGTEDAKETAASENESPHKDGSTETMDTEEGVAVDSASVEEVATAGDNASDLGAADSAVLPPAASPEKRWQEICFELPVAITMNHKSVTLNARAESGLPVAFESGDTTIAEIHGDTLCVTGPGEVAVTAYQEGDSLWAAAEETIVLKIIDAAPVPAQPVKAPRTEISSGSMTRWLVAGGAVIVTGAVVALLLPKNSTEPAEQELPVTDRPPGDPVVGLIYP